MQPQKAIPLQQLEMQSPLPEKQDGGLPLHNRFPFPDKEENPGPTFHDSVPGNQNHFAKAPIPYAILNVLGHILEANENMLTLMGLFRAELLHYRFDLFLDENYNQVFIDHLNEVATRRVECSCELALCCAANQKKHVRLISRPFEHKGRILIRCILIDITPHRGLEADLIIERERALQAARFTNELLANVSHELRTPLSGVIGFAEILQGEVTEEQREYADLILRSGNRLLRSVNAVLDFARIQAQFSRAMLQTIDVGKAVFEQCQLLEPLAARKGLHFSISSSQDTYFAEVDPAFLDRIIDNLVGNAIKYTQEGSVDIRIDMNATEILISITDTGIGITPEFMPFIYQPFRQQYMGDNRPYDGVGLGLSITKRLVDLMYGKIDVDSSPNEGSTFVVRFERSPKTRKTETPPMSTPAVPSSNYSSLSDCRLLVVEDNPETQVLVEKFLEGACRPVITSNYDDAVHIFEKKTFDVVLLDINLGDYRTGKDLLLDLRTMEHGSSVYAVAFTAYALPSDQTSLMACGFDDYVSKPFTRNDLTSMLQRACTHYQQKTEM